MSRFKIGISLATLTALTLTGLAVADENKPNANAIVPVTAHFTASGDVKTSTCPRTLAKNVPNNTVLVMPRLVSRAQLSGTSTSTEKRLSGPVRISLKTVVNSNGIGSATGTFRIPDKIDATLVAVVSNGNRYDGFIQTISGRKLFANFSATASAATPNGVAGSTITGDLGSGSHLNNAVFGRGGCQGQ